MCLLVLLRDDPRLDTVLNHVIDCNAIPQVNGPLHAEHSQNVELRRSQVVEQLIKLDVLTRRLTSFVDRDDQLVGLLDGQLALRIHDGLHARLYELLLEHIEVLEVLLLLDEVVPILLDFEQFFGIEFFRVLLHWRMQQRDIELRF